MAGCGHARTTQLAPKTYMRELYETMTCSTMFKTLTTDGLKTIHGLSMRTGGRESAWPLRYAPTPTARFKYFSAFVSNMTILATQGGELARFPRGKVEGGRSGAALRSYAKLAKESRKMVASLYTAPRRLRGWIKLRTHGLQGRAARLAQRRTCVSLP